MSYPKSRKDQYGNLNALEQLTTEQLQDICNDYDLSTEGNNAELVARIREYEFKTGKTIQPSDQQSSQTSTQPRSTVNMTNKEPIHTEKSIKADKNQKSPNTDNAGLSLPGKMENDAEYNRTHGGQDVQATDTADNRNDRTFRNPKAAGEFSDPKKAIEQNKKEVEEENKGK